LRLVSGQLNKYPQFSTHLSDFLLIIYVYILIHFPIKPYNNFIKYAFDY